MNLNHPTQPSIFGIRRARAAQAALAAASLLWASNLAWSAPITDPLVEPGPAALTNTLTQIAALQAEARALSPTQKKIATSLRDALREFRGDAPRPYAPKVHSNLQPRAGGMLLVDIRATVSSSVLAHLRARGAEVVSRFPQYRAIRANIPLAALELIAAHADIQSIRPAEVPIANAGTATSEGYAAEAVDQAELNFNANGSGVKVGVLSSSVSYLATSQANGDLPFVNVLPGQDGIAESVGDEGEGTAMLEIVYDLVPGASLYFATGFGGEASMASNIVALANAGCKVIIDDVTYNDESPFAANQPITKAVKTVSDSGVLFFSSAANSGSLTKGTSGTWTGNFVTYGFNPTFGQLHNWGGTPYNQITRQNGAVNLFWSDPLGGATNNYNLFITDVNGNVLRQSITVQNGSGDPYESVAASTNSGEYVVVALASGTQRDIWVGTGRGRLAYATAGNTRGHNAAPAANAFSVAAASAAGLNHPFAATNQVESFSSDGLPRLFYESDGTTVTPNDLTASGGRVLLKPEITAADGVLASTGTFGTNLTFTPFFGTSAAAPHAGAIAALLLSYRPDLTPAQIRQALTNSALDIESAGFDKNAGFGIIMANAALNAVDDTLPVVAVTSPANNGAVSLLTSISGTASDIGSGLQGNHVLLTLNHNGSFWSGTYWTNTSAGDPTIVLSAPVSGGSWSFTNVPSGASQGQGVYYVSAWARDNANNLSQAQSGVNNTSFTISTTPPTVAITFPPNGSVLTNQLGGNWFQGTANANLGLSVGLSLFIRRDSDGLYWTGSGWGDVNNGFISNTNNSGTHTWQSTGALPVPGSTLANGTYNFIAIAKDAAGNQQQVDSVVTVDFHPIFVFTFGSQYGPNPNNNWSDGANWDVGSVPTPEAHVIIPGYAPDSTSLGSMQLYELEVSGGQLTMTDITVQKLNVSGGQISGDALTLTANGVFNWSGGTVGGNITVPAGATLYLSSTNDKAVALNSLVALNGTTIWTDSGRLCAGYGVDIENTGAFVIQGDAQFYHNDGYAPVPGFNNTGILQKSNATGFTVISADNGGWYFSNSGMLDIESGVLSSQAGLYLNPGTRLAGAGVTSVDAGYVLLTDTMTLLPGATFQLAGGVLDGQSSFAGSGNVVWSAGLIYGTNTIQTNVSLFINSLASKVLIGALTNQGTALWTGGGQISAGYGSLMENDGLFLAENGAVYAHWDGYVPVPLFVNTGTFVVTNNPGYVDFDPLNAGVAFNNQGTVIVQGGSLSLGGGGASQNATFNVASSALLELNGGTHFVGPAVNFSGSGLVRLTDGGLDLAGTNYYTTNGTLEIAGGSVTGLSALAGAGVLSWSGGNISAGLTVQSNVFFSIQSTNDKTLGTGGWLTLLGNSSWSGTGQVQMAMGTTLTNAGSFVAQNDARLAHNDGYTPVPLFVNNGTFTKTNSTGTTVFDPANAGVALNNNGTLNVASGSLLLGGGGEALNGRFKAAAGSWIDYNNGGFSFRGNTAFSNPGTNLVSNASLLFNNTTSTLVGGTFQLAGGQMFGTNTFAGAGAFNWNGGTLAAVLNLPSSVALTINGASVKNLAGTLTVAGNTVWTGTGNVNASMGSALINNGTFTAQNGAQFVHTDGYTPQPQFVNNGTFAKTLSPATNSFSSDNGGVTFANNGTVNVQAGVLDLGGGGAGLNGTFTTSAGARIDLSNGAFSNSGSLALTGAGLTRLSGATFTLGGGTTTLTGTFEVAAGSLNGSSTFAGPGTFNWSGGSLGGSFVLQNNVPANISGAADKFLGESAALGVAGVTTWTGTGNLQLADGSVINNTGTFIVQNDSQLLSDTGYSPSPVFNNSGTFRKTTALGTTTFRVDNGGVSFNNSGTLDLQTGTVAFNGGATSSAGSKLAVSLGGTVPGTQFGVESFGAPAGFAGTLAVALVNGFAPTNGQSFALATFPSSTGQFALTQLPTLPPASRWQVTYNPSALLLSVVPATAFQSTHLVGGNFALSFAGQTGSRCLLEASTNLLNWSPLLTNTPFNGTLNYTDALTAQFPKRFYRATVFP